MLGHPCSSAWEDGLTKNDTTLLGSHNLTLHQDIVLVDLTVVWEATQWGDVLLNGIGWAGSVVLSTADLTNTNVVDLLVDLGT